MPKRYIIVVGDTTTAGGQTIEGLPDVRVACTDGGLRAVTCPGHAVTCGQCGRTTVSEGAIYFGNLRVAYDGAALACGHRLVSRKQRLVSVEVAEENTASDTTGPS
ncbi:PAAR domain-containing protein [Lysobacter sp. FW306-1B-D06B]|uniref:PAAR domain-containing protein n=1 Tax=Lysobacter sp. FW306-1B-D06B TaxID=3140250 RepID=UPI003140477F